MEATDNAASTRSSLTCRCGALGEQNPQYSSQRDKPETGKNNLLDVAEIQKSSLFVGMAVMGHGDSRSGGGRGGSELESDFDRRRYHHHCQANRSPSFFVAHMQSLVMA